MSNNIVIDNYDLIVYLSKQRCSFSKIYGFRIYYNTLTNDYFSTGHYPDIDFTVIPSHYRVIEDWYMVDKNLYDNGGYSVKMEIDWCRIPYNRDVKV